MHPLRDSGEFFALSTRSARANHGLAVVAPDWNSHADDGGRADLLRSLDFTRERAEGIVLVWWSLGGVAAAGLTIEAARIDVALRHTVCLAGAFMAPDPVSGRLVTGCPPTTSGRRSHCCTACKTTSYRLAASRDFAATLNKIGWPVDLVELAADHGSIAGADHDPVADRYGPGQTEQTLKLAGEVAARIAATLRYE